MNKATIDMMIYIDNSNPITLQQVKRLARTCVNRKHGDLERSVKEFQRRLRPILAKLFSDQTVAEFTMHGVEFGELLKNYHHQEVE